MRCGERIGTPARFISKLAIRSRITIRIIRFGRLPTIRALRGGGDGLILPVIRRSWGRGLAPFSGGLFRGILQYVQPVALDARGCKESDGACRVIESSWRGRQLSQLPPARIILAFRKALSAFRVNHRIERRTAALDQ
jgi:hypothetical protein